jgi:hypothetical protein
MPLPGAWGVPLREAAFVRARGLRALSPSHSLSPRSLNRRDRLEVNVCGHFFVSAFFIGLQASVGGFG